MPVPALEATHTWTPIGPSGETATPAPPMLNAQTGFPRVKIDKITGWYSLPEADDNRTPKNGRDGEIVLPSAELGKTIVYEGRLQSSDLVGLETMADAMRGGFHNRFREGQMLVQAPSAWSSRSYLFSARVMQFDCDMELDYVPNRPIPFQLGFQLGLRMSDARFYDPTEKTVSGAAGATVVANVGGNAPTLPTFVVVRSAASITLLNTSVSTSNGTAELRLVNAPTGTLTINFSERTIINNSGTRLDELFDPVNSDWWDELIPGLIPGPNSLRVDGGSWTARWRDATV